MTARKSSIPPHVHAAIAAAQEKQAADIVLLDLEGLGAFTDYFLVCTGFSSPQVKAICDEVEERLEQIGVRRLHREGKIGQRLDAARFWRPDRARFHGTRAAFLRSRTSLAGRSERKFGIARAARWRGLRRQKDERASHALDLPKIQRRKPFWNLREKLRKLPQPF